TAALDETLALGVVTNLRFLRWLVRQPVVLDGQVRIDTLDRIWPPDDWTDRARIPDAAWRAGAIALAAADASGLEGPWAGPFRVNGPPSLRVAADGEERQVRLAGLGAETDSAAFPLSRAGEAVHVDVGGRSVTVRVADPPDVDRAARAAAASGTSGRAEIVAPMPGSVLALHVTVGDTVASGDAIATLEAMKMEHAVVTPTGGRVTELLVRPADQVSRAQPIAIIEP
ncbi:MAG TPA: biotin/lipoyl-containing protein, partial [Candidatus Limnocylindrales bacterium]